MGLLFGKLFDIFAGGDAALICIGDFAADALVTLDVLVIELFLFFSFCVLDDVDLDIFTVSSSVLLLLFKK